MNLYAVVVDGVATCFETGLLLFFLKNEEIKGKKTKQIYLFLGLVISIVIMSRLDFTIWSKTFIHMVLLVGMGSFIYACSPFKLLFYGIIDLFALIFSEAVAVASWNIYNKPILADNIIYEEDFSLSFLIVVKAFHFFTIMLCKKITSKEKKDRGMKELIPLLSVGIPFLLIFQCLNILLPRIRGRTERVFYLISCVAVLCGFVYILVFLEKHLRMQRKAKEEEIALYETQLKYGYYEKRKEDEEKVREIYHDLKNHLLLLEDDEAARAVAKKIECYESYIATGNEFLDIIISEKVKLAQKHGIQIECDIDFSAGSFVETLDISTIFGNLIDNAIEAAVKVNESEKYIFINAQQKARLIIIVIKNAMVGLYNSHNTRTSKSNSSFHGYGIANVKRALRKYNGDLDITVKDNEFIISIVLPIPKEELGEQDT